MRHDFVRVRFVRDMPALNIRKGDVRLSVREADQNSFGIVGPGDMRLWVRASDVIILTPEE